MPAAPAAVVGAPDVVAPLRVSVLGPVRAWWGERELNLGPPHQRALFALLAAGGNRPVSRDELIDAIWERHPPATAVGSLHTYVSGLRRALPTGSIGSGRSGYMLRVAPGQLDSERFTALCVGADERYAAGDPGGAATRLHEALALWHGEAFAALPGERLALARAHLAGRRLAAAERRARIMLGLGDDGLPAELAALLCEYPLHEPLYELAMRALHRIGRHAEALEMFRTARCALVAELGVEPGPALRRLHDDMLHDQLPDDELPHARPTSAGPPGGRPLVGRAAELDRLRALLADAVAGRGAAVWLSGEAGIGKTALLTAFRAVAGRVLGCGSAVGRQPGWVTAHATDRHRPLQVITRALGTLAGPARTADQLLNRVWSASATAPLVLMIDDFQHADDETVWLWDRLVADTRRLPLLLVAAAPPRPDGHRLTRLSRAVQARHGCLLRLTSLPEADLDAIIADRLGALLGPNLRAVLPAAAGNPRYALEMVATLQRRGTLRIDGGRADLAAPVPVEAPDSLRAAVLATLRLLPDATRALLRAAARLGTPFTVDDLVIASGRDPFDLAAALEPALAMDLLVDAGGGLAFRHPYLCQALCDDDPAPDRDLSPLPVEPCHRRGRSSPQLCTTFTRTRW